MPFEHGVLDRVGHFDRDLRQNVVPSQNEALEAFIPTKSDLRQVLDTHERGLVANRDLVVRVDHVE